MQDITGKTIATVDYDYDDALRLHFTDGSTLYASGVWHNDDTAGIEVALLEPDAPKSWDESKTFYDVVGSRAWDRLDR